LAPAHPGGGPRGRTLDGAIDNLMIHRAELSPKEVLEHYEAGRSAPEPALGP
jgi:hypothetical protein